MVLESDDKFSKDSSREASAKGNKECAPSLHPSNRYASRYSPPSLFLLLALLLLGVSTNYLPITFAEARASTGTIATTFSPTKSKLFMTKRSSQPHVLYSFGNFGHKPKKVSTMDRIHARACKMLDSCKHKLLHRLELFLLELTFRKLFGFVLRAARLWVFWFFSKDCMSSIYEDRWHAERNPDKFFGSEGMWVTTGAHKDVVKRRIQRSRRNRQWVGLGYTPRLVWLVGVLLRGTFQCTAIPKVFNPSMTGWGAGTILGAKCTHQEWIATFMIGWFGSEYYWKYLFGCRGPPFAEPGFTGIPVFITKIRNIRP